MSSKRAASSASFLSRARTRIDRLSVFDWLFQTTGYRRRRVRRVVAALAGALALLLVVGSVGVAMAKANGAPNPCDSQAYYTTHYAQCDDRSASYSSWYWLWHAGYHTYVEDDPDHPRYHPKGYYDSPAYYHSQYYRSGEASQGDGPSAGKYTSGSAGGPRYGGGGRNGARTGGRYGGGGHTGGSEGSGGRSNGSHSGGSSGGGHSGGFGGGGHGGR